MRKTGLLLLAWVVTGSGCELFWPPDALQGGGLADGGSLDGGGSDGGPDVFDGVHLAGAVSVTAGRTHTCAATSEGEVLCWGDNRGAQSDGVGATTDRVRPERVVGVSGATGVAAGESASCALTRDGGVWCWGTSLYGELGRGNFSSAPQAPGQVSAPALSALSGQRLSFCASGAGRALCWGSNGFGQCGQMDLMHVSTPVEVALGDAGLVAEGYGHACVATSAGARCFGINDLGQVTGTPTSGGAPYYPTPQPAPVSGAVTSLAAGDGFSCAVKAQAAVCWGDWPGGASPSAAQVPGLSSVEAVFAGYRTACATVSSGGLWCWGANSRGQVGPPDAGAVVSAPRQVPLPGAVRLVAIGEAHVCALLGDSSLYCWGQNDEGQLGNGTRDSGWAPSRPLAPF